MEFDSLGLLVFYCISLTNLVGSQEYRSQEREEAESIPESMEEPEPPDHHTFVALIDIVFTDGTKRTCTGTIIHDNVVITAAHCFIQEYNALVKPELTASFVVIGTKKMYDTGYEQYLPIERVVTHPKFKAWTADLSLVFTFAAMTSDKPGTVIPIAGEQDATPVDSNVTVFSWGHCKEEIKKMLMDQPKQTKKKQLSSSIPDATSCEEKKIEDSVETGTISIQEMKFNNNKLKLRKQNLKEKTGLRIGKRGDDINKYRKEPPFTSKRASLYIHVSSTENDKTYGIGDKFRQRSDWKESFKFNRAEKFDSIENDQNNSSIYHFSEVHPFSMKSYYRNWRRQMGSTQNQLLVESFDLMNIQMCKKIIQKAMPAIYAIKHGNDVMCYSSDEHYITSEDAGAPAIRNGQLLAVTVGGAECDGDHIALGMKMACYCSWIARHLPGGGDHLNCCKNCCIYTEDGEVLKQKSYRNLHLVGRYTKD